MIHWLFFGAGVLDLLILDVVTKYLVVKEIFKPFVLIPDFFYTVAPHKNSGIAFGIGMPLFVQIAGSLIILFLLFKLGSDTIFNERNPSRFQLYVLGAVIGGGMGNLLDRILHGYVIDFIVLRPIPVFNVADIGITVGLAALFGTMWLTSKETNAKNR